MAAKIQTLEEAFVEEIKDLYDAEKQLVRSLPKMAKAAHSEELRAAFKEHLEVTKEQVSRLEQVFELLEEKAKSKPCKGMKGLIEEGQELIEEKEKKLPAISDLDLIAAAQKVEHYEISGYGTMRTFAQQMGNREVAQLLDQTLKEEEQTDKKLTAIAKSLYKEAMRSQGEGAAEDGASRARPAGRGSASSRNRASEAVDEDMLMEEEE
jgi:ferritin-like metal-binding protein YciE